jgi:hypothetical protein
VNPWEILLTLLGWTLLTASFVVVVIILLAVVYGVATWVRGLRTAKPAKQAKDAKPYPAGQPLPDSEQDDYMAEATVVGISLYGSYNPSLEAFRQGARWAWTFFHRK